MQGLLHLRIYTWLRLTYPEPRGWQLRLSGTQQENSKSPGMTKMQVTWATSESTSFLSLKRCSLCILTQGSGTHIPDMVLTSWWRGFPRTVGQGQDPGGSLPCWEQRPDTSGGHIWQPGDWQTLGSRRKNFRRDQAGL